MPKVEVRKRLLVLEEIFHEGGPPRSDPHRRGAVLAVIRNPFAGRYEPEIQGFMDDLRPLGLEMAHQLAAALGGADRIEGYGKASLVGAAGELEHGALWHAPGGYAMREVLNGAKAIVPSAKKVGTLGTAIDIPLHHINAAYVRSHFTAIEVRVQDAPRSGEIVYILAMSAGPRIHARVGGLAASEIKGEDGQR